MSRHERRAEIRRFPRKAPGELLMFLIDAGDIAALGREPLLARAATWWRAGIASRRAKCFCCRRSFFAGDLQLGAFLFVCRSRREQRHRERTVFRLLRVLADMRGRIRRRGRAGNSAPREVVRTMSQRSAHREIPQLRRDPLGPRFCRHRGQGFEEDVVCEPAARTLPPANGTRTKSNDPKALPEGESCLRKQHHHYDGSGRGEVQFTLEPGGRRVCPAPRHGPSAAACCARLVTTFSAIALTRRRGFAHEQYARKPAAPGLNAFSEQERRAGDEQMVDARKYLNPPSWRLRVLLRAAPGHDGQCCRRSIRQAQRDLR